MAEYRRAYHQAVYNFRSWYARGEHEKAAIWARQARRLQLALDL